MDKDLYLIELSESPRTDFGKRAFEAQNYEQKIFSAVWRLQSLVNIGGFHGYFGNEAETVSFAPTALQAIGAAQCAAIVTEAVALRPAALPADSEARWAALYSLPEPLSTQLADLDGRFFDDPDDLTALLFAFVATHPDVFGPIPSDP